MLYERNDLGFKGGTFRVRGDIVGIIAAYENKKGYRIEFFGDEIDRISEIDVFSKPFCANSFIAVSKISCLRSSGSFEIRIVFFPFLRFNYCML